MKKIIYSILTISLIMVSNSTLAINNVKAIGNCNAYENKTGKISSVLVGNDDSKSVNLSFKIKIGGGVSNEISVKPTLDDASGRGMYQLLLTAWTTQNDFKITRCYSDQLAGAEIIN